MIYPGLMRRRQAGVGMRRVEQKPGRNDNKHRTMIQYRHE
jgi:hypothetical protein